MELPTLISTDEWEKRFGREVRRLRNRLRLTQDELAINANISTSSVQSLERGGGSSLSTVIRVARALGRTEWLNSFTPEEPDVSPVRLLREREQQEARARSRVRRSARPR
ncbi:MAG: helix-turn-helix domain-containing protein [Acidimicrobiales bacterium]